MNIWILKKKEKSKNIIKDLIRYINIKENLRKEKIIKLVMKIKKK